MVLVILGILGGMAAMFIAGTQDEAMRRATAAEINILEGALKRYRLDTGVPFHVALEIDGSQKTESYWHL